MFLATADHYDFAHQALAVPLGLNGLRVSEACETNVEDLAVERGPPDPADHRQGKQAATIPLAPRTAPTIDLVVGERHDGPILRRRDGQRLDRRTAHRRVASIGKWAGLGHVASWGNIRRRVFGLWRFAPTGQRPGLLYARDCYVRVITRHSHGDGSGDLL